MAIATKGGHVSRALDFYNGGDTRDKYFVIGGPDTWEGIEGSDSDSPISANPSDFNLYDVYALKRVDNISLVVQTTEDDGDVISYGTTKWKRVDDIIQVKVSSAGISAGSDNFDITSNSYNEKSLKVGSIIIIDNKYRRTITSLSGEGLTHVTVNSAIEEFVSGGSFILGGALAEQANHVYVDCTLLLDTFPVTTYDGQKKLTYRQIGLCTGVIPAEGSTDDPDILRAAAYSPTGSDQYSSLGILEILDNRNRTTRDANQSEKLSLIIEF